jgi:hypothetical protein
MELGREERMGNYRFIASSEKTKVLYQAEPTEVSFDFKERNTGTCRNRFQ